MKKSILYILSAILLTACGSVASGKTSTSVQLSSSTAPTAPTSVLHKSKSFNPPDMNLQFHNRQICSDLVNQGSYAFGSGSTRVCETGGLDFAVETTSPRYDNTPVAVTLEDTWYDKPVSVSVSAGKLVPISPWIFQTDQTSDPFSGHPQSVTEFDNVSTKTVTPTAQIPKLSSSSGSVEVAAWLWYPPSSSSSISIPGAKPIVLPAARPLPAHVTVTPNISSSISVGLSLTVPTASIAAAEKYIHINHISGIISASSTGFAAVAPPVSHTRTLTLQGEMYTWSAPKVGQSLTLSDRILNVPVRWTSPIASVINSCVSIIGDIHVLNGLTLTYVTGSSSVLVTPQGRTTSQLTVSAPAHAKAGSDVLATANLTRNGRPWVNQPISITTSQAQPVVGKTTVFGGFAYLFSHVKAGKLLITARSGKLAATATVLVTSPFPWWLLIIIMAAALIPIIETVRRYRKRNQRKVIAESESGVEAE